jgi:UDP-galactopyranose mutase
VQHDWLVVGAGFTGATLAERLASQLDQRVLVIDRRDHVAGNAFDGPGPDGQPIHHYGAHIFHTTSDRVWNYLSQFTGGDPMSTECSGPSTEN